MEDPFLTFSTANVLPEPFSPELLAAAKALTHKQHMFVEHYLVNMHPGNAAVAAGYVRSAGTRLLTKPYIARAIEAGIERKFSRIRVTQDRVVDELCKMAFSNMGNYLTEHGGVKHLPDMDGAQTAAIKKYKTKRYTEGRGDDAQEVEAVEFELYDKMGALKLVGEHLGMFASKSKLELSGPDGGAIPVAIDIVGIAAGTFIEPDKIIDGEVISSEQVLIPA